MTTDSDLVKSLSLDEVIDNIETKRVNIQLAATAEERLAHVQALADLVLTWAPHHLFSAQHRYGPGPVALVLAHAKEALTPQ